jgi:hypothetical protein
MALDADVVFASSAPMYSDNGMKDPSIAPFLLKGSEG